MFGDRATNIDLKLAKHIPEPLDEWTDRICQCVDDLFQQYGFVPIRAAEAPVWHEKKALVA
jgi:hypothetical protein